MLGNNGSVWVVRGTKENGCKEERHKVYHEVFGGNDIAKMGAIE